MRLGTKIPNFEAYTTKGKIHFHNWSGNSWVLMFSHPADFTPVCTTELGRLAERAEEFKRRGVKLLGHSCDSLESHLVWIKDIQAKYRRIPKVFPYPIIGDETREIAEMLDMVDEREPSSRGVRAVLVIDPQKILRLFLLYPDTTGRNIDQGMKSLYVQTCQNQRKHDFFHMEFNMLLCQVVSPTLDTRAIT
ncbi:peroxiredoxin-6 isoform X2 [Cephus cinctus]|uniref:thioredoxin-dependent peroxiredoxin n=1 Tax=Cephus cinctus TaxID=211228 RepID=A0AAJ7RBE2_CEPCN|nr:peroxiredoxin-6 isoform X2 [Cephus cinctus]